MSEARSVVSGARCEPPELPLGTEISPIAPSQAWLWFCRFPGLFKPGIKLKPVCRGGHGALGARQCSWSSFCGFYTLEVMSGELQPGALNGCLVQFTWYPKEEDGEVMPKGLR